MGEGPGVLPSRVKILEVSRDRYLQVSEWGLGVLVRRYELGDRGNKVWVKR